MLIAFLGVFIGDVFHVPEADGIASLLIGILLSAVAIFLASESKKLLVGEGLEKEDRAAIKELLAKNDKIEAFGKFKSIYFGPTSVLLALDVNFIDGLSTDELEQTVINLEQEIRDVRPYIDKIYIESRALKEL